MQKHIHRPRLLKLSAAALLSASAAWAGLAVAAGTTKDIVLDRVSAPVVGTAVVSTTDAMAVSVLLESPDGSLQPRSTERSFRTGDRFRVKVLASRAGKISFYNTNPSGVLGREPIWQGEVQPGLETISPRLRLDGQRGVDQLHVVLEPAQEPQGVWAWVGSWLTRVASASKDIRLDVQNTETATYLVNQGGQGIVTTISIAHR
ncbi:MAG: hypothetical protein JNJ71_19495 [Rubrivivax sp.]|nr:hypothetical protein [Rubrivivax sp.]